MKVRRYLQKRMSLEAFADKHNLVMEVHERRTRQIYVRTVLPLLRFYCAFAGADVIEGIMVRGVTGEGMTEEEAMADYAEKISGETLVFNGMTKKRREIEVPLLVKGGLRILEK